MTIAKNSHVVELHGGPKPLILCLHISQKGTSLDIREHDARSPTLRQLTDHCYGLYAGPRGRDRLVGVLLHLTDGFGTCIEGYRIVKVKHMTEAGKVLDARTANNAVFERVVHAYNKVVFSWIEPYRNLEIPREIASLLKSVGNTG